MSSIVRLIFKIQEEGEAILKAIPKQLEAVNQAIQHTNVAPLNQVSTAIQNIDFHACQFHLHNAARAYVQVSHFGITHL